MCEDPLTEDLMASLDALAPKGHFVALHIRYSAPLRTFQSYDPEWLQLYAGNSYAMRDPVILWGFSQIGATRWSDIDLPDPFDIMGQARNHGLVYGAAFSHGPINSRSIGGCARDDREFTDDELAQLQRTLARLHDHMEPQESLTEAQIEALRLIAAGDRHAAAAAKLEISESALKARLTSARQKLSARTTAEALQRAKEYRLL